MPFPLMNIIKGRLMSMETHSVQCTASCKHVSYVYSQLYEALINFLNLSVCLCA
jgi:hypothetical protein